jgi:hypothetical protein
MTVWGSTEERTPDDRAGPVPGRVRLRTDGVPAPTIASRRTQGARINESRPVVFDIRDMSV